MIEFVTVRASAVLGQQELIAFLKSKFPDLTRPVGGAGAECVEARIRANSPEFEQVREFIEMKRNAGCQSFSAFTLGRNIRKYSQNELFSAEVLRLTINSHFEPSGEECGTIYETLCPYCNLGHQISDLILDVRRIPRRDISETIAWIEWAVSSRFIQVITEHGLTGAKFVGIVEYSNPTTYSKQWHQLQVTGVAGELHEATLVGRDPFSPSEVSWRCPRGHSTVAAFLSEIYLNRASWNGCDIAVTTSLFGQGRGVLRPTPLIIISQRMYRALRESGVKGFSCEVAHLV